MIVRLTATQRRVIASDASSLRALSASTTLMAAPLADGTKQSFDCELPAAGWRFVLERLDGRVLGPRGGIRRGAQCAAVNARRRISRALAALEAHPALRHCALAARSTLPIPAWPLPDGCWSIYPTNGRMVILWPEWEYWRGLSITKWHPTMAFGPSSSLADEAVHRGFVDVAAEQPGEMVR